MRLKSAPRVSRAPSPPELARSDRSFVGMETEQVLAEVMAKINQQTEKLDAHFRAIEVWQNEVVNQQSQIETNIQRSVNGGIQFGAPFSDESLNNANIAFGYRHFYFDNASGSSAAICVDPRYGDSIFPPRGWFVVQIQEIGAVQTTRPILILDQILSSTNPSPSESINGYQFLEVVGPRQLRGYSPDFPVAPNGWVGNDVRPGDQISTLKTYIGPGSLSIVAGSANVRGTGTAFTKLHRADYIRATGTAGFNEWKQIKSITDDTHLVVNDPFRLTGSPITYEAKIMNNGWLTIASVTLGVAAADTLELKATGPVVGLDTGVTGVQYVIRRPIASGKVWIRVVSESPNPVCATLGFF